MDQNDRHAIESLFGKLSEVERQAGPRDSEAEGFKRQSREYDRLWRQAGFPSTLMEIPDRNHFDVILDLADEDTALTRALLRLVGGKAA